MRLGYLLLLLPLSALGQCGWASEAPGGRAAVRTPSGDLLVTGSQTAAFSPTGALLWELALPGTAVAAAPSGGSYVAGQYSLPLAVDTLTLPAGTGTRLYLARLDADRRVVWALHAGGTDTSGGIGTAITALDVDPAGNVYATGYFRDTLQLGAFTLAATPDTNAPLGQFQDAFVAKLSPSGTVLWARSFAGPRDDRLNALHLNGNALYLTGMFTDSLDVDVDTLRATGYLVSPVSHYPDILLMRLDTAGNVQWAREMGSTFQAACPGDEGFAVRTRAGRVYLTGTIHPIAFFGGTVLNAGGSACTQKAFLASFSTGGTFIWAREAGSHGLGTANAGFALNLPSDTEIQWGGFVEDTAFFDGASVNEDTLFTNGGSADAFLARYDSSGTRDTVVVIGGTGYDAVYAFAQTTHPNWQLAGLFNNQFQLGSQLLTATGANEGFAAQLTEAFQANSFPYPDSLALGCGETFQLDITASPGFSYTWVPQSGLSSGSVPNPVISPAGGQTYVFTATGLGCTHVDTLQVVDLGGNLNVAFTASQTVLPTPPFTVSFVNQTPNAAQYTFTWDFGDGKQSGLLNPTHTYIMGGAYTVRLIAEDPATGCTDSFSLPEPILAGDALSRTPRETGVVLRASPNPASAWVTIENPTNQRITAVLTSQDGHQHLWPLQPGRNRISLEGIAAGVYALSVRGGGLPMKLVVVPSQ